MGTMRTRWLIDFDGCIANSRLHMLDRVNEQFGTGYTKEMMTDASAFWKDEMLPPHRAFAWSESCFDSEKFLKRVPPNKGIIELIQLLLTAQAPVYVITDRPSRHVPWLARYLAERHVVCPIVSTEEDDYDKAVTAVRLNATTVADDMPGQISTYLSVPSITKIFLYEQPWNKTFLVLDPVERVSNWSTVGARIRKEMTPNAEPS